MDVGHEAREGTVRGEREFKEEMRRVTEHMLHEGVYEER